MSLSFRKTFDAVGSYEFETSGDPYKTILAAVTSGTGEYYLEVKNGDNGQWVDLPSAANPYSGIALLQKECCWQKHRIRITAVSGTIDLAYITSEFGR